MLNNGPLFPDTMTLYGATVRTPLLYTTDPDSNLTFPLQAQHSFLKQPLMRRIHPASHHRWRGKNLERERAAGLGTGEEAAGRNRSPAADCSAGGCCLATPYSGDYQHDIQDNKDKRDPPFEPGQRSIHPCLPPSTSCHSERNKAAGKCSSS